MTALPPTLTGAGMFVDPNAGQHGFDPVDQAAQGNGLPGPDHPLFHVAQLMGMMMDGSKPPTTPELPTPPLAVKPEIGTFGTDELEAGATQQVSTADPGTPQLGMAVNGSALINDANKYLGIKYVYGGTNPATGLDCSGFTQRVYADMGITIPRVTYDQVKAGMAITDRNALQPGDAIFMWGDGNRVNGHTGIYVGNGVMIDAPHTGAVVRYDNVPWDRVTAMRRFT